MAALMKESPLNPKERGALVDAFLSVCEWVKIYYLWRPNLPDESDKHARLRQLARHRDLSVNKLMEELATISLAEFDAENHFRARDLKGSSRRGLPLLDKLDAAFRKP